MDFKESIKEKLPTLRYYNGQYNLDTYRELQELVMNNIPQQLYRYRSFNYNNLDALEKGLIFGTVPDNMNDPFDSIPSYDIQKIKNTILSSKPESIIENTNKLLENTLDFYLQKCRPEDSELIKHQYQELLLLKSEGKLSEVVTNLFFETKENLLRNLDDFATKSIDSLIKFANTTYVSSFTTDIKNELMWGHYADGHRGFALEYDFNSINGICTKVCDKVVCAKLKLRIPILPVLYGESRFDANDYIIDCIENEFNKSFSNGTFDFFMALKLFMYKNKAWQYEDEWRLVFTELNENKFGFLDILPTHIFVGSKASKNLVKLIANIAHSKGIPISREVVNYDVSKPIITFEPLVTKELKMTPLEIMNAIKELK